MGAVGVTVARRKPGTRGEFGREGGMHASNASALCASAHAVLRVRLARNTRAPGIFTVCGCRVGDGTHVVSVGSEGGRSERQEIKTDEGEFWVSRRIRDAD